MIDMNSISRSPDDRFYQNFDYKMSSPNLHELQ